MWLSPDTHAPVPARPFFTGVHRFGIARFSLFLSDPFHTLLKWVGQSWFCVL